MRNATFSLHFAMGVDGEFGNAGRLPWGSYSEELDFFWQSMQTIHDEGRVLIVGKRTFDDFPKAVKNKFIDAFGGNLFLASSDLLIDTIVTSLPEGVKFACIGGAAILEYIMDSFPIDSVYTSLIGSTEHYDADTYLDTELVADVLTDLDIIFEHEMKPNNQFSGTNYIYKLGGNNETVS